MKARLQEALDEEAERERQARRLASAGPKPPRFVGSREENLSSSEEEDGGCNSAAEFQALAKAREEGFNGTFSFDTMEHAIDTAGWEPNADEGSSSEEDSPHDALLVRPVLFHILRELSYVHGPPKRVALRAHQVCSTWRDTARAAWFLYRSAAPSVLVVPDLIAARFSVTALTKLDASDISTRNTAELAKFLGRHCTGLVSFVMHGGNFTEGCEDLVGCAHLEELDISYSEKLFPPALTAVVLACRRLRILKLRECTVSQQFLQTVPQCPSLSELDLSGLRFNHGKIPLLRWSELLQALGKSCKKLKRLTVDVYFRADWLPSVELRALGDALEQPVRCSVESCEILSLSKEDIVAMLKDDPGLDTNNIPEGIADPDLIRSRATTQHDGHTHTFIFGQPHLVEESQNEASVT